MSRILFAWELGGYLGHLERYLPMAQQLRQGGHEIQFALKDRDGVNAAIDGLDFTFVQAPCSVDREAASREHLNYADILAAHGFGDAGQLAGLMDGWASLFRAFRPDIVVAQFAPSAVLAAKLTGLPVMRVDCGFGCPPDEAPFPSFRPWLNVGREELLVREQHVLGRINRVTAERGVPPFPSLQDVFRTTADLLLTVPELDHYTGRRNSRYAGPIVCLDAGLELEWPEGSAPRIFVYLRPFEGLPVVLNVLASVGCSVIAFLPGIADDLRCAFSSASFRISTTPVRLSRLLATTDLAITHGGHGLASACLFGGLPMLLVPQVAEQLMTACNFERLGIGTCVRHDEVGLKFASSFSRMLKDSTYRDNAGRLSRKYAGYDQNAVVRKLCALIEETAASGSGCSGCA